MSQEHRELANSLTSPIDATGNLDIAGEIEDIGKSSYYRLLLSSDEDGCPLSVYPLTGPRAISKPGLRINVAVQRDHPPSKWVETSADPFPRFG